MRQQNVRSRVAARASRVGVVGLALAAALTLAGCASGQLAHTAQELPAVNGALGQSGKIAIRDATLVYPVRNKGVYPKGSDAELAMTIVSRSVKNDKLIDVSSPAASSVTVRGSRIVPGGGSVVVGMPAEAGNGGAEPEQVGPFRSASTGSTGDGGGAAAQSGENADSGHLRIVLNELTMPFRSGQTVRVTLTFRRAGSITLDMPIATPQYQLPQREHGSEHGESGGATDSEDGH